MTTTRISTTEELERFEFNGALENGALVVTDGGDRWLAFDSEDGALCLRPPYEGEGRGPGIAVWDRLEDLPLPLTITTERN